MNSPMLHEVALARHTELLAEAERRRQARLARPPGSFHLPSFLTFRLGLGRTRSFSAVRSCPEGQPC